eukprot:947883-Pelagomonas_calceolata.AAC.2
MQTGCSLICDVLYFLARIHVKRSSQFFGSWFMVVCAKEWLEQANPPDVQPHELSQVQTQGLTHECAAS